jgi:hypothetical protein
MAETKKGTLEQLADVDRLLAEKKAELAKIEADLEARKAGGLPLLQDGAVHKGDGYVFRVGPRDAKHQATVPVRDIEACDESEAKRFFCATTPDPTRPGRQLDPVRCELKVEMIQGMEKRKQVLADHQRAAMIRTKWRSTGQAMPEELEWMESKGLSVY